MKQEKGYVITRKDDFEDKKHTSHRIELRYGGNLLTVFNKLRRIQGPTWDMLVLDCRKLSKDGSHSEKLIVVWDGGKVELKHSSITEKYLKNQTHNYQHSGWFDLDTKILARICDAKSVRVRFTSRTGYIEPDEKWCNEFLAHCQQFYNNVYDDSRYLDAVSGLSPAHLERDEKNRLAKRTDSWNKIAKRRNIGLLIFFVAPVVLFFVGMIIYGKVNYFPDAFWTTMILMEIVLGILWIAPQIQLISISNEIDKECPKCNQQTITLIRTDRDFQGVRSAERIVTNQLSGERESKQVTVSDYEITKNFECSNCFNKWSHSYIERG